jgi:aconitate hydratase
MASVKREQFEKEYSAVFEGDQQWRDLPTPVGETYTWDENSTYVALPPYFAGMTMTPPGITPITGAKVLGMFGDSITTDHISPAGNIAASSPAGVYLQSRGVAKKDFNSYGARRGHHEVMMRGTFANIRLKNELVGGKEGWWTATAPGATPETIFDVAMRLQGEGTAMVIIAGKEYGTGSSRDWAAKGTRLLGVRGVIAESFERIHRSNLVGMGVLPMEFVNGDTRQSLGLTGFETIDIAGVDDTLQPRAILTATATGSDGSVKTFSVRARIDTPEELQYFRNGGILPYVLRNLARGA